MFISAVAINEIDSQFLQTLPQVGHKRDFASKYYTLQIDD